MTSGRTHLRGVLIAVVTAAVALVAMAVGLHAAGAAGSERLLPRLEAEPPTGPEIVAEGSKRLLLKFNGFIHNIGGGALDMEGSRSAPKLTPKGEAELHQFELTHENLSESLQSELANPPMHVSQNVFTTNVEERNIERPHDSEPSPGSVMIYANADGHNHWHLQHVAEYSLWNEQRTAKVAPSQKVGFCLEDSEKRNPFGPSEPVYEDKVRGEFCERFRPQATHLREGISRGWRDRYLSNLAFQWVDISNVTPGVYVLREDVNPEGNIQEERQSEKSPAYSSNLTIPGWVAKAQSLTTPENTSLPVTLTATAYGSSHGEASYSVVTQPSHGTLSGSGSHLTYTPQSEYSGPDEFTFATRDTNSPFPRTPATATVTIAVGDLVAPTLAITSAPEGMTAGTSAVISAQTTHYHRGTIEWSATAGSLAPSQGQSTTFTAPASPPAGGTVTVTARLSADPSVTASRTIQISPVPPQAPAQDLPLAPSPPAPTGSVAGEHVKAAPQHLSRPRAMVFGSELVISTTPEEAGWVGVTVYHGPKRLGHCGARTVSGRRFLCRIALRPPRLAHEHLRVVASLHAGGHVYVAELPPEILPEMRMVHVGRHAGARAAAFNGTFWCSPSTLEETLAGGEE